MRKLNIELVLLCFFQLPFSLACNFPPKDWCSSPDIARLCQVEKQCEMYLKSLEVSSETFQELVINTKENDVHYFEKFYKDVKIGFYYETLCPDCKHFMKTQLYPAYKAIPQLFTTDLVPYGNAKEFWDSKKWQFRCQHGPEECYGNIIHTCALNDYPYNVTFPFIACMEQSVDSVVQSGKSCAKRFGLDWNSLDVCSGSLDGNMMQHSMALKTEALKPTHNFVPWITLNGEHTDAIQNAAETDLIQLICDNFKGIKPKKCFKHKKRLCPNDL